MVSCVFALITSICISPLFFIIVSPTLIGILKCHVVFTKSYSFPLTITCGKHWRSYHTFCTGPLKSHFDVTSGELLIMCSIKIAAIIIMIIICLLFFWKSINTKTYTYTCGTSDIWTERISKTSPRWFKRVFAKRPTSICTITFLSKSHIVIHCAP